MKILVCGARGFIGRRIVRQLQARGHQVVGGVSSRPGPDEVQVDFAADTTPAAWLPRLAGIDAVVVSVGVLRDTRRRPIRAVHELAPMALFDAAVQAGVRRIVHISALGLDGLDVPYARTKLAAERHLQALVAAGRIDGAILRPSVVFGLDGASSQLFIQLAKLPAVLVPGPMRGARIQPVAVDELVEVLVPLVDAAGPVAEFARDPLPCVGPEPVSMTGLIASLRTQAGHRAPAVLGLPGPLTWLSARMGDLVPPSPWCSETLAMLASDNTAPPQRFEARLGRRATAYGALLGR